MGNESDKAREFAMDEKKNKKKTGSLRSVFMHADGFDKFLMSLGLIGAVADGFSTPVVLFVSSHLMNDIGTSSNLDANAFRDKINKNCLVLLYMALVLLLLTFL
ncbi:hypothetical protein CRG98_001820, partial [Punica granatum]